MATWPTWGFCIVVIPHPISEILWNDEYTGTIRNLRNLPLFRSRAIGLPLELRLRLVQRPVAKLGWSTWTQVIFSPCGTDIRPYWKRPTVNGQGEEKKWTIRYIGSTSDLSSGHMTYPEISRNYLDMTFHDFPIVNSHSADLGAKKLANRPWPPPPKGTWTSTTSGSWCHWSPF